MIEPYLTVGVRQNLFSRWTGMGAPRRRKPSGCGGVGRTGDEVEMKPAVPQVLSVCGVMDGGGEQWQPGFLLRKKKMPCHGERGAGRWGRVPRMHCLRRASLDAERSKYQIPTHVTKKKKKNPLNQVHDLQIDPTKIFIESPCY